MVLSRRGNEGGELPSLTATINMFRTCTMFVIPVFSCTGAFALSGTAMSSHSGAVQKQKSQRRQLMPHGVYARKKRIVSNCIHAARWREREREGHGNEKGRRCAPSESWSTKSVGSRNGRLAASPISRNCSSTPCKRAISSA